MGPRLEAAAQAAERLVALREEAEKDAAAFVANDRATVRAFTCEVLRLRPYDATYVWWALVHSDWQAQWDPLTFLRKRVWAMRQEERRREVRWARRNRLQPDSGWREGRVEREKLEEFFKPKRRTLSLEEHVEVVRMVRAGELSVDAARLLEARLAGVTRRMWKALGWDEQRMERVWKELYLAIPILKRRLGN